MPISHRLPRAPTETVMPRSIHLTRASSSSSIQQDAPAKEIASGEAPVPLDVQAVILDKRNVKIQQALPVRAAEVGKALERLLGQHSFAQIVRVEPEPGASATSSSGALRLQDQGGRWRTLHASASALSLTVSSEKSEVGSTPPAALDTSVESVLRGVVYSGRHRWSRTEGGLLIRREGPADQVWKPFGRQPPGRPKPHGAPILQGNGRVTVIRNKRELVDLTSADEGSSSNGEVKLTSRHPIKAAVIAEDKSIYAVVRTGRSVPGEPVYGLLTQRDGDGAPVESGLQMKDDWLADEPKLPYSIMAEVQGRLLLVGREGGVHAVDLSTAAAGRVLRAEKDAGLQTDGKVLGFARVADGKGATVLHLLSIAEDNTLRSRCWDAQQRCFVPGEHFGSEALSYALPVGCHGIEVPHGCAIPLDSNGRQVAIIQSPSAMNPGLRNGQLVFRDVEGDWKPFNSKFRFHQLSIDPYGRGRLWGLVGNSHKDRTIVELRSDDARQHIPLGRAFHEGLAEAGTIRMVPVSLNKAPVRFAAAGLGALYYEDGDGSIRRHDPSSGPAASDGLLTAVPAGGPIVALACNGRGQLHVLAGEDAPALYRHVAAKDGLKDRWEAVDFKLEQGQRLVDLTHTRLGDLLVHVQEENGGRSASLLRVGDAADAGSASAAAQDISSQRSTSSTRVGRVKRAVVRYVNKRAADAAGMVKGWGTQAIPAIGKTARSMQHWLFGHPELRPVYEAVHTAIRTVQTLAPAGSGEPSFANALSGVKDEGLKQELLAFAERLELDMVSIAGRASQAWTSAGPTKAVAKSSTELDGGPLLKFVAAFWNATLLRHDSEYSTRAAQALQCLQDQSNQIRYAGDIGGVLDDNAFPMLLRARMAAVTLALYEVRRLCLEAGDETEVTRQSLHTLKQIFENHTLIRTTDMGFADLPALEVTHSTLQSLRADLLNPASELFGGTAAMLDEAGASDLCAPFVPLVAQWRALSEGEDKTKRKQGLIAEMRQRLTRHLMDQGAHDVTVLKTGYSVGLEPTGFMALKGDVSLELSASSDSKSVATFRMVSGKVQLLLERCKEAKKVIGVGIGKTNLELLRTGLEMFGNQASDSRSGGRAEYGLHQVDDMIVALFDPDCSVVDLLGLGQSPRQVQESGSTKALRAEAYVRAGKFEAVGEGREVDFFGRPMALHFGVDVASGRSKGVTAGTDSNGLLTADSSRSVQEGVGGIARIGGQEMYQNVANAVEDDDTKSFFGSLGLPFKVLPTWERSFGSGIRAVTLEVRGAGRQKRLEPGTLASLLRRAAIVFAENAVALNRLAADLERKSRLEEDLGDLNQIDRRVQAALPRQRPESQVFLELWERMKTRHEAAELGVMGFDTACASVTVNRLQDLELSAPQAHAALQAALQTCPSLQALVKRAEQLPGAHLHIGLELKPQIDRHVYQSAMESSMNDCSRDQRLGDIANYRLSHILISGKRSYAKRSNLALLGAVSGHSSAEHQTLKGSIDFLHDAEGNIAGIRPSLSLLDDHHAQADLDEAMKKTYGLEAVTQVSVRRRAVLGQSADDATTISSRSSRLSTSSNVGLRPASLQPSGDSRRLDEALQLSPQMRSPLTPPPRTPPPQMPLPTPKVATVQKTVAAPPGSVVLPSDEDGKVQVERFTYQLPRGDGGDPAEDWMDKLNSWKPPTELGGFDALDTAANGDNNAGEVPPEKRKRTLKSMAHKVAKEARKAGKKVRTGANTLLRRTT